MPPACGNHSTSTTTMEAISGQTDFPAARPRGQTPSPDEGGTARPSSPSTDYEFDEAQCLFCNQPNPNLDQNLIHMSKTHGLHVETTGLLVDVECLLAYFHLIISGYYECLYCGTQRNTREAVQQHMMAKGHCKYDINDEAAELRDFYEVPSSDAKSEVQQRLSGMRFTDDSQIQSQIRVKKGRPSKQSGIDGQDITASSKDQTVPTPAPQSHSQAESSSNATEMPSQSLGELSTRAQKQEHTLGNQLAQLRANDRRSLVHLPASQQRALLATHHKQMEKARRTEQTRRGHLESAGNKFNRLGTTRLVRIPPHLGHVQGLNR